MGPSILMVVLFDRGDVSSRFVLFWAASLASLLQYTSLLLIEKKGNVIFILSIVVLG